MLSVTPAQVRAFRLAAQQVDGASRKVGEVAILDLGVQDTGGDGGRWALACRGVDVTSTTDLSKDLFLAWTLRGAPHLYRRRQVAGVAAATTPWSERDAASRIFDASKPLKAAGIGADEALAHVAAAARKIVAKPTSKGDLSTALTKVLDDPYLRFCRSCDATHAYEQVFRLSALQAGLELQPDTSPPVLERIAGWKGPAKRVPPALDLVDAALRFLAPASTKELATFLDTAVAEVTDHLPDDVVEVSVTGEAKVKRWLRPDDATALEAAEPPEGVRFLAPFDLFLQARDRTTLVPDAAHRKVLWVTLGRPGAILRGADVVGTWRPRTKGKKLAVETDLWAKVAKGALADEAARLAAFRGLEPA